MRGLIATAIASVGAFLLLFVTTVPFYGMTTPLPAWLDLLIAVSLGVAVITGVTAFCWWVIRDGRGDD